MVRTLFKVTMEQLPFIVIQVTLVLLVQLAQIKQRVLTELSM